MKDIIEKLNNVKNDIIREKTDGFLRFFGLIARIDLENKWDILISADWIDKSNLEQDFVFLINKLKTQFNEDLGFLSQIVFLAPDEPFIKNLARAIKSEDKKDGDEACDLKISEKITINHIFIITSNFKGIDLGEISPVGSITQDAAEF